MADNLDTPRTSRSLPQGSNIFFSISRIQFIKRNSPQSANNFGSIETRPIFGEHPFPTQMEEKFTTIDVLHDKAQPMQRLK